MIRKPGVGIVDYGCGNIASVRNSLARIGYRPQMLRRVEDFEGAKVIVLPGVGAFPAAMATLRATGLDQGILAAHRAGKRIVGICLGMQLLAQRSYEIEETIGLGLMEGEVRAHPEGLQVGWSRIEGTGPAAGKYFYFNHSYRLEASEDQVLYRARSGTTHHAAIVRVDNVIGIQFHPEKSQRDGLDLLVDVIAGRLA